MDDLSFGGISTDNVISQAIDMNNPISSISSSAMESFKISKVFKDHVSKEGERDRITSIDFDSTGEACITTSTDDTIHIYDCRNGTQTKKIYSKKYGCTLAKFTHRKTNIIYASTKEDDTIRYLSTHDNKYLRYFKGHRERVISLEVSPVDDQFLSASLDNTIRLWDLKSSNVKGMMTLPGNSKNPCVAYDHDGLVFAVGIDSISIRLYDVNTFEKGPFSTFVLDKVRYGPEWISLRFSPDGKLILISTKGDVLYLVDAYNGNVVHILKASENRQGQELRGCFSPDSKYVLCGSADGTIQGWSTEAAGKPLFLYDGHHESTGVVEFNPKYLLFASADSNLAFWQPSEPL
ncbi:hypothetical protein HK098_000778 [Nowakowskiella sp. JEL0407]|nr:hypothetical protein HK098_000778 [Nowakowskiella sp. JEL0407]